MNGFEQVQHAQQYFQTAQPPPPPQQPPPPPPPQQQQQQQQQWEQTQWEQQAEDPVPSSVRKFGPMCLCQQPKTLHASKKQGPNYGRPYWRCPQPHASQCDAFEWDNPTAEEIERSKSFKRPRRTGTYNNGSTINAEQLLQNQQQLAEVTTMLVKLHEKVDMLTSRVEEMKK